MQNVECKVAAGFSLRNKNSINHMFLQLKSCGYLYEIKILLHFACLPLHRQTIFIFQWSEVAYE